MKIKRKKFNKAMQGKSKAELFQYVLVDIEKQKINIFYTKLIWLLFPLAYLLKIRLGGQNE